MIVVGTGWRRWVDRNFIFNTLDRHVDAYGPFHLRVGDCTGADELMAAWAYGRRGDGVTFYIYRKDPKLPPMAAPPARNRAMLRGAEENLVCADLCIGFPQPGQKMRSPGSGTTGCLFEANMLGIDIFVPGFKGLCREERTS